MLFSSIAFVAISSRKVQQTPLVFIKTEISIIDAVQDKVKNALNALLNFWSRIPDDLELEHR